MQRIIAALLLASLASATPEKYKPMVKACEGLDKLANCTTSMQGVCHTSKNGFARMCSHHCDHHYSKPHNAFFQTLQKLKEHIFKHEDGDNHREWMDPAGDCEGKKDGEACTAPVAGQCIPTGKCPVFHGQTVCKPYNAHPPKFVTDACKGKSEGDHCRMMFMSGKCQKIKYFSDLSCTMGWPHLGMHKNEEETQTLVV